MDFQSSLHALEELGHFCIYLQTANGYHEKDRIKSRKRESSSIHLCLYWRILCLWHTGQNQ